MKSLSELGVTSVTRFFSHWHRRLLSVWLVASLSSGFLSPSRHSLVLAQTLPPHAYQHQSGPSSRPIKSCSAWFAGFPPTLAARLFPFVLFGLLLGSGSAPRFHPTRSYYPLLHAPCHIVPIPHSPVLSQYNIPVQITHVIWTLLILRPQVNTQRPIPMT